MKNGTIWKGILTLILGIGIHLYGQSPATPDTTQPSQTRPSPVSSSSPELTQDTLHFVLDEVVVTATRTEKKIIDIPYSVQQIDNRRFRFERRVAVNDVLGTVPGLFLQSRYGNHDVRISIRGFGSRSNSGIRGVRILLDGIPESEPDGQTRIEAIDFNSVGRIEIVKGNSSSLYTNAPGGVINFINDIDFHRSFVTQFNEIGSFDLRRNGIKFGIRSGNTRFLTTYSYHNYRGYRRHSSDFWHILNTVLETTPGELSRLQILGYFVGGRIRLPGSLTREQFAADPFQPNPREVDRDTKRISKKGRLGLRFQAYLDARRHHEVEITGYGTIKYFERASGVYRIINRYGLGSSFRYVHRRRLFGRSYEFSVGGDLLYQTGPIEWYENINGRKSDILNALTNEAIANVGFYFQNTLYLIPDRLSVMITGRYDKVVFDQKDQLLAVRSAKRRFQAFTPKVALNLKLSPYVAVYTSYGRSFDSPAGNEMDNYPLSSNPNSLLNPDLKPQKSRFFEMGIKGNAYYRGTRWFNRFYWEATFFHYIIDDEIVPFEVFGDVFFRNSAQTRRTGLELGGHVEIVPGLRLESAYTFSDFVYRRYLARSIEFDARGNLQILDREFSGNGVPSVPRHNLSLSLALEHKFSRRVTGFTKAGFRHVSAMWVDDRNTEKNPAFSLANLTIGLDVWFRPFNLLISGGINNLFNRTHAAFININSARKEFYEAGEPRHYFINVNLGYAF